MRAHLVIAVLVGVSCSCARQRCNSRFDCASLQCGSDGFCVPLQNEQTPHERRTTAAVVLVFTAVFGWVGFQSLRRRDLMSGSPVPIAQARSGYVLVRGTSSQLGDEPLLSPHSKTPCVWWHYEVLEHWDQPGEVNSREWRTIESKRSHEPFLIRDETGALRVDPNGAELSTTRVVNAAVPGGARRSLTERVLPVGAQTRALGHLIQARTHDFVAVMSVPKDGKAFIVSDLTPESYRTYHTWLGYACVGLATVGAAITAWVIFH